MRTVSGEISKFSTIIDREIHGFAFTLARTWMSVGVNKILPDDFISELIISIPDLVNPSEDCRA
jgi:hypothetical protein